MSDWTAGYVADIGYTFGYYQELNPLRARFALLNAGLVCPEFGTACELGFGQGLSVNMHAAASLTQWHGTDFNPAQAGFAQELAAACDSGAKLYDEAFADFVARADLPDFDYIGLHGIWSWISDENRRLISDFVQRKLKVGGVLYVSYNTMPGWATFAPVRHLMTEHAQIIGAQGKGIVSRVNDAIEFTDKLLATNPRFSSANPQVADRMKSLKAQDRHYIAHEYFNRDWHPMHFSAMREWLEPAKVEYACSAHYLDHVDLINLTAEHLAFLQSIPDAMFRESVRDFMVNQNFRRDYWVKGVRKLNPVEHAETLRRQKFTLTMSPQDVSLKVSGSLGEATMSEAVYRPILEAFSGHKHQTLGEVERALRGKVSFPQLLQAAMVLAGGGVLSAVQDEATTAKVKTRTDKLNAHLCGKARGSSEVSYLASPVTGGGIPVNRIQQMFLLAIRQGQRQAAEWAQYAWQVLASQGQKLVKNGVTLETPEDNLAELNAQASEFAEKQLPILKALKVVA
jgi:hypothetical protein